MVAMRLGEFFVSSIGWIRRSPKNQQHETGCHTNAPLRSDEIHIICTHTHTSHTTTFSYYYVKQNQRYERIIRYENKGKLKSVIYSGSTSMQREAEGALSCRWLVVVIAVYCLCDMFGEICWAV